MSNFRVKLIEFSLPELLPSAPGTPITSGGSVVGSAASISTVEEKENLNELNFGLDSKLPTFSSKKQEHQIGSFI